MAKHGVTRRMAGVLACVLILAGGCGTGKIEDAEATFKIGLVTPLSGDVQDLGKEMLAAARLAIGEANANRFNMRLDLIVRDDQGSAASAALAVHSIVEDPASIAFVAAGTSALANAEFEASKSSGIAMLTSTATASDLTDLGGPVFRVIPPNSAQGDALARFAKGLGARTAAIVFQQDDYSADLKEAFKRSFQSSGGTVVAEAAFESDETSFRSQLDYLASVKPSVFLAAAQHVPVARILLRARELGIAQPILAGETAFTDKLLAALGKTAPGQFYLAGAAISLQAPSPRLRDFVQKFEARNGKRPGMYGCYTYDAVSLLAHLVTTAGATDRQRMIAALRDLKVYDGVMGAMKFGPRGDVQRPYTIYTVHEGAFVVDASTSSVPLPR